MLHFTTDDAALLASELKRVLPAIASKATLPILQHVHLSLREDTLTLTATDLAIAMSCQLGVKSEGNGAVTLPGRMVAELLGKLGSTPLTVQANDRDVVTFTTSTAEYTINGLPGDEFPAVPVPADAKTIILDGQVIRSMIQRTQFAALRDVSRPVLCSACVQREGNTLTMATTDTHRLAVDSRPIEEAGEDFTAIIPAECLADVQRAIGKVEDTLTIQVSETLLGCTFDGLVLTSRMIEGQYPDYRRLLREEHLTRITMNPAVLLHAIDRAAIIAREESNKIILTSHDDHVTVRASTGVAGTAMERLAASIDGDAIEIAFNAEYLHDVLSVMDCETVVLGLSGPVSPVAMTGTGIDGYLCLIMPMQVL